MTLASIQNHEVEICLCSGSHAFCLLPSCIPKASPDDLGILREVWEWGLQQSGTITGIQVGADLQ